MFDYSVFRHEWPVGFPYDTQISPDYKVYVNGTEIPVYTCRISKYPFNTWWPGHQRYLDQTEQVSYVNLVSDEAIEVAVEPLTKTAYQRIMLKPYAKGVKPEVKDGRIVFTLQENGGYVLALDDYFGLLYIFNNKPIAAPNPDAVTYYFGPGVYFPGKITLHSGESIYVDKDALVFGCIYAENAENIHIFGNGIFDDSTEERVAQHCYESYCNGNVKFYDCKNVRVEGVGFTNSAIWCVNVFHCFDVVLDGINVFGQWRYNTDGIDVVNSQRITIRNTFVHSFDDTITVKGIDRYAFENNTDILVDNCVLWCDWGRTMEIGLETSCREYSNITFRNCHVLRGASAVCDIQNGDWAEVHHITFENISMELESFYTPMQLQKDDSQTYSKQDQVDIAQVLSVANFRFRKHYDFLGLHKGNREDEGKPHYAGVHDVLVKNVAVYCDEKLTAQNGTKAVTIAMQNIIPTTRYANIRVENVVFNGVKLSQEDMTILIDGCDREALTIG